MRPKDSLRIIHVLNHVNRANGHVCAMVDLACTQAALGHKVYVCSAGGTFEGLLQQHGVTHIEINQERKALTIVKAMAAMTLAFRRVKPDIVHAHMMTSAMLAAAIRPLLRFKLVTSVHSDFEKSAHLMGVGQRVIAVSNAVRDAMIIRGIPDKKIRTVLNGTIGSPRFPKEIVKISLPVHPAITFVGGLHPRKGVSDLIEAHALVVEVCEAAHLYIIGSGPCLKEYTALADRLVPGHVTFLGHADDPRSYLAASEIFTLPSRAEPAGLVISEAREAGCAVVASNVGGIPEMVGSGEAGILVPPRRPDLLAKAFIKLLQNPAYLAEMRTRSQLNLDNFALRRVTEETICVYQELL